MDKGKGLFGVTISVVRGKLKVGAGLLVLGAVALGCSGGGNPANNNNNNNGGGGGDDNQAYRTVVIGGKTWMAENLNIDMADSWCYGNDVSNCAKYGRLYTWDAAKTACPSGWRLPTRADWGALAIAAGGTGTNGSDGSAGTALKPQSGWDSGGNGTDAHGFSALPGGYRYAGGGFWEVGATANWWTSTERSNDDVYYRYMGFDTPNMRESWYGKSFGLSVRCVVDD